MSERDLYAFIYIILTMLAGIIYFLMVSRARKIIAETIAGSTEKHSLETIEKVNDCNSTLIASLGILVFWASPAPLVMFFTMFSDDSSQGIIQSILNSLINIFLQGNYIVTYFMAIAALCVLWFRIDPNLVAQTEKMRKLVDRIMGDVPNSSD